ncbi:nuclear protein MDM1 isoform X1 [Hippocampus zosterae]|uniref:nuclear protein MDM1 isoform X1 n=1 Tax=Hippocampus zosterae TaxID=109293 RepID=UPI00223E67EF|nr:nuclear protein MDM1 isoform X1 [Hippocampus zosterae]
MVTSERQRSFRRSRSLSHSPRRSISSVGRRRPHRAGSREDHPADERRSGPAGPRARSAALPAARNEDKDRKRAATPAGSDRVAEIHPSRKAEDHRASARNATDAGSPLLAAQQVLRRRRPAFQTQPVATEAKWQPAARSSSVPLETEYRRSFQGRSPSRGPRLRKHLDRRQRHPAFHTRSKSQKMREESEKMAAHPREDAPPAQVPRRHRKPVTEYQASFPGPLREAAGAPSQVALLRQKASWYRRRAWGTNFSRRHLSQLKSRYNVLWEPDGGADTDAGSTPSVEALDLTSCSASSCGPASPARGGPAKDHAGGPREGRSPTLETDGGPLRRTHLDVIAPAGRDLRVYAADGAFASEGPELRSPDPRRRPADRGSAPPSTHVIRGWLRHAEFQHNGELGLRFRSHAASWSDLSPDESERLSVMSSRSLASCSAAAAVLERAQRRPRQFWETC